MAKAATAENKLFFGDNLDVLREKIKDESVDLIYLDPPFNSSATYNVLFNETGGGASQAQAEAFRDTWGWGEAAAIAYDDVMRSGGHTATLLAALRSCLGDGSMLAYLAMMSARLVELRRVLSRNGSLYLHCDSTASHYLKLILDGIFGPENFRNEIIWKRQSAHSDATTKFPAVSDTLLFYAASRSTVFTPQYGPHDPNYVEKFYRFDDSDGRGLYRLGDMSAPKGGGMAAINKTTGRPNGWHVYKGFQPPRTGWRYSPETMTRLDAEGRINFPTHKNGELDYSKRLSLKRYLKEQDGSIVTNIWTDITSLTAAAAESLGYPTQKPLGLLRRLISASSAPDAVILDPFCGCGTSVEAAESLQRRWLGIDVTHYAITLIEKRLKKHTSAAFEVNGRPTDFAGALACCRFRGHRDWVFHEAGEIRCRDGSSVASSRLRQSSWFEIAA